MSELLVDTYKYPFTLDLSTSNMGTNHKGEEMSNVAEFFRLAYHGYHLVKEAVDKMLDQKREEKRSEAIWALNHNEIPLKNSQALSKLLRDPAPKPDPPTTQKD